MVEKIYLRIYPTAPPDVHYRDHVTDFRFDTHPTNQMNDHLQNKLMIDTFGLLSVTLDEQSKLNLVVLN
ncbi:hypothetical protein RRG08_005138 [Elysia crispata]|uniref:Uncharacterized protein n=1 Tax=Elysia crispata TaxID=231223 RepID=A0AAE0ZHW3_9GAST|nr:hypothetical protein RRG08_005138 [Elysia crispata]